MSYGDPTIKEAVERLDAIQKLLEAQRPRVNRTEQIAEAIGLASLKQDLIDIKADLKAIKERLNMP